MAIFKNMVITDKGKDLYNKVQTGIKLEFTKMAIGSGQLNDTDNPEIFTELKEHKFDVDISSVTTNTQLQVAIVNGTINNTNITEGQYICELGLYAKDPDLGEILYGYTNAGTQGDYIAPNSSGAFAWNYQVNAAVGNAETVTATVSSTTFDYAVASSSSTFAVISGTNQKEINESIDKTISLIKNTVNFVSGSFTASTDNTSSFLILVPYNPSTDHIELFYHGNTRMQEGINYTKEGTQINLNDWSLNSGETITYNVWQFVNNVPIMADGKNLQDNSVAKRSLTEDVQNTLDEVPELSSQMAEKASLEKSNIENFIDKSKVNLILAGIDSLTNGAGETKYLDYFSPRLRGEIGDGGIGYCAFDIYSQDSVENFSIGYLGMSNLSATPNLIDNNHKYSFDLKGVYRTDGDGTQYVNVEIKRKFKHSKIVYLKQPDGGSFDIRYNGDTIIHVDTSNDAFDLGSLDMPDKDYFLLSPNGNALLRITNILGSVCIYGGIFTNDTGVAISPIGRGGNRLEWHNNLDKNIFAKWLTILQPNMFIFNGGTNDNISSDFNEMLSSYLQPYVDANCNIILIRPHQMSSDEKWSLWETILKSYAKQKHLDYISEKYLLGSSYLEANANGYMLDGTHSSVLGNKKRSNNLLQHLGIPIIGLNKTEYVEATPSPATKQNITNLTNKITYGHATIKPDSIIYTLGLRQTYNGVSPKGIIEIQIRAQINGDDGSNIKIKKIMFPIWNITDINNHAQCDNSKVVVINEYTNETASFDFDISLSIVDDKVVVNLHTNYMGYVNYIITAISYVTTQDQNGNSIYEN